MLFFVWHRPSKLWTLLASAILPQQNITSIPKWYIWWVLPISRMSSDLWPTFQGQISQQYWLSVHPLSPSLYTWLTSNHHCIFIMHSSCISHYYFGSLTFDLGMVTFTLTLLVTAKLPERNIPSMPKRYICCILPISQMSSMGSDLGWTLSHFSTSHRSLQDLLQQYYLYQTSHPFYKREHLVNLAIILYTF